MIVVLYLEITQIGIMYVEIAQIGIIMYYIKILKKNTGDTPIM